MKFRQIDDLTSDTCIEAFGKDLKEVFENSAFGMFSIMCRIKDVKPKKKFMIEAKAANAQDLLYSWLSQLIATVDAEEHFFSSFRIKEIDEHHLKAEIAGEPISSEKGSLGVKAVTMYNFKLEKEKKGHKAAFAIDI